MFNNYIAFPEVPGRGWRRLREPGAPRGWRVAGVSKEHRLESIVLAQVSGDSLSWFKEIHTYIHTYVWRKHVRTYITLHSIALHCIPLHSIPLHCIALHSIALHSIALHCIPLHCTALHSIALHCIPLHCIAFHCIALHSIALHCIAFHCIALHCVALHYITLHTYIHLYNNNHISIYFYLYYLIFTCMQRGKS